jgi:APA family basic amino acid/polyamine antiporter
MLLDWYAAMDHSSGHRIQTERSRDLGLVSTVAIGAGTMIAAGIFTLSGLAVADVGSAAIVSFLLAAAVAGLTALSYCEFASIYPKSGEGYAYARMTFIPPLAYMVGWCLLVGCIASCAFYIASLSSYFGKFIWPSSPGLGTVGVAVVVVLTLLNMWGTRQTSRFQVIVTAVKIALLLWFVAAGLGKLDLEVLGEEYSTDMPKIASSGALVFVTFYGFSAIAGLAGEVKDPARTVQRAMLIAMCIVAVLYVLVVMALVAVPQESYTETSLGDAAKQLLGPVGGSAVILGALFSMLLASNGQILAGSRLLLLMSQFGHLPKRIGSIHRRTQTPIAALLLVGASIAGLTLLLDLRNLAYFANGVLMVAMILINAALIQHRRRYPDLKRPFRVPLVPWVPAFGVIACIYMLAQLPLHGQRVPTILSIVAVLAGFLGFIVWKGAQPEADALEGTPSRVASEDASNVASRFRVLVPIANPANVNRLIDLAAAVAAPRNGEIVALRVMVVPQQLPPGLEEEHIEAEREILAQAHARALEHGVQISSLVRIGHNLARAILETSRQRHCDLILLGWKGHTSSAQRMLGSATDDVVRHARTDLMLVKLVGEHWPLKRLLLPTAGGKHARRAEAYAADIAAAQDGSMMLCSVVSPAIRRPQLIAEDDRLQKTARRIHQLKDVKARVLFDESVAAGIIAEASDYDAIVVGATGQSFSMRFLFGTLPEHIARDADRPVIVIKHHDPVKALLGRVMGK